MLADVRYADIFYDMGSLGDVCTGDRNQKVVFLNSRTLTFGFCGKGDISNIIELKTVMLDVLGADENIALVSIIFGPAT